MFLAIRVASGWKGYEGQYAGQHARHGDAPRYARQVAFGSLQRLLGMVSEAEFV